jgi:hypothetical protein
MVTWAHEKRPCETRSAAQERWIEDRYMSRHSETLATEPTDTSCHQSHPYKDT